MEVDYFEDVDEIDQNLSTELLNLSISEGDSHDALINELKQLMPSVVKELSSVPLFFKPLINLKNFPLNSFIPTRQKCFTSL
jgi:hypothetical protein